MGDFNGDGDPDLAVADQVTGEILVLRGTAGGGFTAPTPVGTATGPFSIAVGEFNGDGDPEPAVADQFSGNVLALLGNAGATFNPPATVASGADPDSVAVGDFNGDGDPDLAVADQSPGEIMVLSEHRRHLHRPDHPDHGQRRVRRRGGRLQPRR